MRAVQLELDGSVTSQRWLLEAVTPKRGKWRCSRCDCLVSVKRPKLPKPPPGQLRLFGGRAALGKPRRPRPCVCLGGDRER